MVLLNKRPWNIEAQAHLLDNKIKPNKFMLIRNNELVPENINAENWNLTVKGESVLKEKTYTLTELKTKFKHHSY